MTDTTDVGGETVYDADGNTFVIVNKSGYAELRRVEDGGVGWDVCSHINSV